MNPTVPIVPEYGLGALSDVFPSILPHLGLRGEDVLGFPDAERYLVILVDALGAEHLDSATTPYMHRLAAHGRLITSGVPSTTVTSLTSLGTGLTPGQHGMAGYTFRLRPNGRIFCPLDWPRGVSAADVQPQITIFERLRSQRVPSYVVVPDFFRGTGMTQASMRGSQFFGVRDEDDLDMRIELAVQGASQPGPSVGYLYERRLDQVGHPHGVDSPQWRDSLRHIDSFLKSLRTALPADVIMVITGDHGMVNVDQRVWFEQEPELCAGVAALAGEPRFRHLYTAEPDAVARRWRDFFGADAWVSTRAEAINDGWFGPTTASSAVRFGDVVVASTTSCAVVSSRHPNEANLKGMHGSLTSTEMRVPLLVD